MQIVAAPVRLARLLRHAAGLGLTAVVVTGCCAGLDGEEADKTLRVELDAPAEEAPADEAGDDAADAATDDAAPRTKLCGAEVIAVDEDGEEILLQEVEIDGGCVYIATVEDPFSYYTITASHPDIGAGVDFSNSNPACSIATDPADNDAVILLEEVPVLEETEASGDDTTSATDGANDSAG